VEESSHGGIRLSTIKKIYFRDMVRLGLQEVLKAKVRDQKLSEGEVERIPFWLDKCHLSLSIGYLFVEHDRRAVWRANTGDSVTVPLGGISKLPFHSTCIFGDA
jgi:hypothetical protein